MTLSRQIFIAFRAVLAREWVPAAGTIRILLGLTARRDPFAVERGPWRRLHCHGPSTIWPPVPPNT